MIATNKTHFLQEIWAKIAMGFAVVLFLTYWSATCFFTFPDTSVVIGENYKGYTLFSSVFYQRWTFFAPPPTYNFRMHYIYRANGKMQDVEVFEAMNQKIRDKFLTNDMYTNVSWMLFSNVDNVVNMMRKTQQMLELKTKCAATDTTCLGSQYIEARNKVQETKSMAIITNHARTIAKGLNLGTNYELKIAISTVEIPKYAERYKTGVKSDETPAFISSIYNPVKNSFAK